MAINKKSILNTFGLAVMVVVIFALTRSYLTKPFALQMTLVSILVFAGYAIFAKRRGNPVLETSGFIYVLIATVLFLVGSTGWFFSPFFFALYLVAIISAFVFGMVVSFVFVITLVVLFSFNIGEVSLAYDFLVVLSLLTVIPVSSYLRKEYLRLREAQKKILVLESEGGNVSMGKIEEILANKVNNFAVNLRQPINDVKQLAYRLGKAEVKGEREKHQQRIIASSEEALRMLKGFEEETTGKKLLSTPDGELEIPSIATPVKKSVRV